MLSQLGLRAPSPKPQQPQPLLSGAQVMAMAAPLGAAATLAAKAAEAEGEAAPSSPLNLEALQKQYKALRDRVYYGDALPPVGSQQLSYARFMELLADKRVKRIMLLADGQIALVEVRLRG